MGISANWRGAGLAIAIGAVLATGAAQNMATAQTVWSGSSSREDLLYRLDVLDAEIADIRARLSGTGVTSGTTGGAVASGDVGALENEVRRLTEMVEKLQNTQRLMASDLTRRLGDIEFRLNELEGNPTDATTVPVPGPAPAITVEPQGPVVSVSERGDLDRAINDVKQGRFDQAEDRLRKFMSDFPGSPLVGEAWHWVGESQFVRGIHADAARSYLNGYEADRAGPHAAHNLYRLGVTLGRLGQINEACLTLREVRSQFPAAPDGITAKADTEADTLSCN